ncbi:putative insulin-like peptide beta-type 1 [Caenorhabditis elegans]|uniref:Probable insulin-like peptide beta-type 1 n=1 Tax=Caenorhabditis elegans TaxID=6239 RepID=ILB1_CAEEL|nr:putative insulin-like peptide beta-type 1 [Caenorhabditis elegans]Q09626.1 RecName: Full=Probable insulin-like peptide beta-type 1; Flags: Precursor [Caenorhabditis elegans]CCD61234.1 Probable insulin-like peptide beta-type 1 [Caenorhabditis elegans]|eukprot:NP_495196.1 Probable insulin-like peptide beta-type 1 [Caenorhabditis elegans]
MFSFFTYFLLSALLLSASCRQPSMDTSKADRILREIEMETELENQLSRARRVPAGEVRACGRRLLLFVWSTCGEPCTPQEDMDIATVCCTTQCTPSYIKQACCPEK